METQILEIDLLRYEQGTALEKKAIVEGVFQSLQTGFVYVQHDLSEMLIDDAYAKLEAFFSLPRERKQRYVVKGAKGEAGYTGLLVETAAVSSQPDFKEMLNWGRGLPEKHPLRQKYPHRYFSPVLPDEDVPGIYETLTRFYEKLFDVQRRFLRIIAEGIGCHTSFFDDLITDGPTLSRAIHYPPMNQAPDSTYIWAEEHADIDLITALPRATARGLQVKIEDKWVDAVAPKGMAILNTGLMLERITNGVISSGIHRVIAAAEQEGPRMSVVQFCHPAPCSILGPVASCISPENPQRFGWISAGNWVDQVLHQINLDEEARRISNNEAIAIQS